MTSGRFRLLLLPAVLGGVLVVNEWGCGGTSAGCVQCPPMEGRYALAFGEGTDPAACASVGVQLPTGPLEVSRAGDALTAQVEDVTLRGTLYQSYDFTLLGLGSGGEDGGTRLDAMSFSGRYVPARGDGGVPTLAGNWQADYSRGAATGVQRCAVTRPFTATRQ